LYVGFGSDASVRTIDLASGEMKTIATLDPGAVVDGMETDSRGNVYVSDFRGKVYRIAPGGQKTLLLDVTGPKEYCANFAYVPDRNLLVIPTLVDNRIIAYRLHQ
jgi:sugar lactone lactonase YvrE